MLLLCASLSPFAKSRQAVQLDCYLLVLQHPYMDSIPLVPPSFRDFSKRMRPPESSQVLSLHFQPQGGVSRCRAEHSCLQAMAGSILWAARAPLSSLPSQDKAWQLPQSMQILGLHPPCTEQHRVGNCLSRLQRAYRETWLHVDPAGIGAGTYGRIQ